MKQQVLQAALFDAPAHYDLYTVQKRPTKWCDMLA